MSDRTPRERRETRSRHGEALRRLVAAALAATCLLLSPSAARCDTTAGTAADAAAAPTAQPATQPGIPEPAEVPETRSGPVVTLHGFLSQAYAVSDGNQLFGIDDRGTANYRAAALQVRAEITEASTFAVQLSHERLGDTPLQEFREDVELDWLFFEHRFGDSAVKVGRVQIPFGIYNEVRDVGTLLPFYRPPTNFYGEGSYTSETVDGILLSHHLGWGDGWALDADVHYGDWKFIQRSGVYTENPVDNSIGAELWLELPGSHVRIGAGGIAYDVDFRTYIDRWKTYHVSLDTRFGPVIAQAEYKYIDFVSGDYDTAYARLGYEVNERLTLNAQVDTADLAIDFFREGDFDDEVVAGVSYAPRPDVVVKLEHHWNEGYQPETPAQNFFAPKPETQYTILSVSSSF